MTLHQQLAAIRADLEARIPQPALDIMHQATADLVQSGQEKRILTVGESFLRLYCTDMKGIKSTALCSSNRHHSF